MGLTNSSLTSHNYEDPPSQSPPINCTNCLKSPIHPKFSHTSITLCIPCYLLQKRLRYETDLVMSTAVQIDCITPCIFLGNNEGAKAKDELLRLGVTHVLVCGYYLHEYYPEDFVYKTVEIEDNEEEDLIGCLMPCIEFIEKSQKVFVHCRAGKSRSSSIVIAYLMYVKRWSYEQAKEEVENKRSVIEPNSGFVRQLKEFGDIIVMCDYKIKQIKEFIKGFVYR